MSLAGKSDDLRFELTRHSQISIEKASDIRQKQAIIDAMKSAPEPPRARDVRTLFLYLNPLVVVDVKVQRLVAELMAIFPYETSGASISKPNTIFFGSKRFRQKVGTLIQLEF